MVPLKVEARKEGPVHILSINGTIDSSNMSQVKSLLVDIREKEAKPAVVADIKGLDFISSMGWGMFINFAVEFKKSGGGMKMSGMNDRLERLFWLMGVDSQVENFKELKDAVNSFTS
jgi:anti-sigma B factor antagonist